MTTLTFRVFGLAMAKGNHRAVTTGGITKIREANPSVKDWELLIAATASVELNKRPFAERELLRRGVRLSVAFYLPRPKKYQRPGIQVAHLVAPDIDKLQRAVQDALSGVVYLDDSQIVESLATKRYAPVNCPPYVDIRVSATAGDGLLDVPAAPLPLFAEGLL